MNLRLCYIILMGLLFLSSCNVSRTRDKSGYIFIQGKHSKNNWKIIWQDEFNGQVLDSMKWSKIPPGNSDWNKHMSDDERCYKLENGLLYLTGVNHPDTSVDDRPFLTGGIYSKGKFAF